MRPTIYFWLVAVFVVLPALNAKTIIRIDPLVGQGQGRYGIPPDNPFVQNATVAPEIRAYGLRYAQQFSWDSEGRVRKLVPAG
jgi:hypothetical protein